MRSYEISDRMIEWLTEFGIPFQSKTFEETLESVSEYVPAYEALYSEEDEDEEGDTGQDRWSPTIEVSPVTFGELWPVCQRLFEEPIEDANESQVYVNFEFGQNPRNVIKGDLSGGPNQFSLILYFYRGNWSEVVEWTFPIDGKPRNGEFITAYDQIPTELANALPARPDWPDLLATQLQAGTCWAGPR